jgi:FAD/FMN-containing dehydrogenase
MQMNLVTGRALRLALAGVLIAISGALTAAPLVVNDVTKLNPIEVHEVVAPTELDEIVDAVKRHRGPISVGGGRFSMGGQTATERALQIDMRRFDRVLEFSKERREITVQPGITWRKIQEHIDPHDLSVRIMQTYANFTVGGSLSVNVHGRYIGQGPLILSVKRIALVLPDGSTVRASPAQNSELFYGAIGGYGAMGIIVEATLDLAENVRVERRSEVLPLAAYGAYFRERVRNDSAVVFHNADIYAGSWDTVRATSYVRTDKAVTVPHRLMPKDEEYWLERTVLWIISEVPGGSWLRRHVIDPMLFWRERVEWRNYEASYDVAELEPRSRKSSTYVLQEYFVPVDRLEEFVPRIGEILDRHDVNAVNVSIRHAHRDPGSLLAWARNEVFAFVLYYKQGTTLEDRRNVAAWTRELIDAATSLGGAYYLPYQIHASEAQFRAAYPNAERFFELKRKVDPDNKFRNKLWDAYYLPIHERLSEPKRISPALAQTVPAAVRDKLARVKGYKREHEQTYLTLPEWMLVYLPGEYADVLESGLPTDFPYFGSIGQFWSYYWDVYEVTREKKYPFNWGYHFMVFVIGASYTVENALKGLHEHTVGRLIEWLADNRAVAEDRLAARVARNYVDFIRVDPWYEFDFWVPLQQAWRIEGMPGDSALRRWERKWFLSAEYFFKGVYAAVIKAGTKAMYGDADLEMLTLGYGLSDEAVKRIPKARVVERFSDDAVLVSLPRYEAFREATLSLAESGGRFLEIAGNDTVLVTCIAPIAWHYDLAAGKVLFEKPVLTAASRKRLAIDVPVRSLHEVLLALPRRGVTIEHVYDY